MAAVLFKNDLTGEAVISFRGTQLNDGAVEKYDDIEADLRLGEGRTHTQFYAAYYFMKAAIGLLSPVQKANLTLTGHSLGGGIASLLGMYMGIKTKVFDPALSLRVARDMLGGGLDGVHAYASDQYIWPPIQGLGLSALQVESRGQTYVQTYISYGDPLSASFPSPSDVAGVRTYYHLNFDRSFFSDNLLELAGTKDNSLHSVNLVALQTQLVTSGITIEDDGTVSQNTALGTASDKLLDLMTQVFDPDVSLVEPIGKKLGVAPGRERYDLFLRQLVEDKINKDGKKFLGAWLQDLTELGEAKGRLQLAGKGKEPGIKYTFEWVVMRSLIQASVQFAAQETIQDHPYGTGIITKTGDIISANLGLIQNSADLTSPDERVLTARTTLQEAIGIVHPSDSFMHIKYLAADAGDVANNTLTGTAASGVLAAFGGDDTLIAGTGAAWCYGGDGIDTASFTNYTAGIDLDLRLATWADVKMGSQKQYGAVHRSVEKIIGTRFDDTIQAGETTRSIYGDAGNDKLYGGSGETHLWGGTGADEFNLSNKSFVEDAGKDDKAYMYGIRLSGGVAQWWSDSGWAYWAPVSSLMMPAISGILGALVLWADVKRAMALRYGFSATGQLITQLALGLGGQAVIEKYELDLDTGAATGGVVAFQQNLTRGSLATLTQYLTLALKAGGFGGFMGLDPLVLDLDGDGVELTREDSSKVYFEFDTDGFGERCGWVDAAVNDNLPPQHLTRRRAA